MGFNLSYYKNWSGFSDKGKNKSDQLLNYSSINATRIANELFFEEPLASYEKENKEKLGKNLSNTIKFFYDYLEYAKPIVNLYYPDEIKKRFLDIEKSYNIFRAKYNL